jgi:hypothetical protein
MEIKYSYRFLLMLVLETFKKILLVIIKYLEQNLLIKHVFFPSKDQNPTYMNMLL